MALIRHAFHIYIRRFPVYLTLLSPILVGTAFLHVVGRYAYFGELAPIFISVFGILLNIVSLLTILALITASGIFIQKTQIPVSIKNILRAAMSRTLPFFALFIIISIVTFIVPAFLALVGLSIDNKVLITVLSVASIAWIVALTLLFLFSSYVLILEKDGPFKSLQKSAILFLNRPLAVTLRFSLIVLISSAAAIAFSIATTIIIAAIAGETGLLFNTALSKTLSPWWKDLVVSIYAYLGLPPIIIGTARLFLESKKAHEESGTDYRAGDSRSA